MSDTRNALMQLLGVMGRVPRTVEGNVLRLVHGVEQLPRNAEALVHDSRGYAAAQEQAWKDRLARNIAYLHTLPPPGTRMSDAQNAELISHFMPLLGFTPGGQEAASMAERAPFAGGMDVIRRMVVPRVADRFEEELARADDPVAGPLQTAARDASTKVGEKMLHQTLEPEEPGQHHPTVADSVWQHVMRLSDPNNPYVDTVYSTPDPNPYLNASYVVAQQ